MVKALVQTCEDSNGNLLHTFYIKDNQVADQVAAAIQTGNGVYPATYANVQSGLKGTLVHRYTTTIDNPKQFLKKAREAVKSGVTDNRQVLQRSTRSPVTSSVGAGFTIAAILAAGGLTVAQEIEMVNTFMSDGVLSGTEIAQLGFNAIEGVPSAIVDVVQAGLGDGEFVDNLLHADMGAGAVDRIGGDVVDWVMEVAQWVTRGLKNFFLG